MARRSLVFQLHYVDGLHVTICPKCTNAIEATGQGVLKALVEVHVITEHPDCWPTYRKA